MGIGVEVVLILEGPGLTLVAVHRHQARTGLAAHGAPLAARREAGAAQPPQGSIVEDFEHFIDRECAGAQALERLVAAVGA